MTTPIALSLLLLLSRAASDPCYDPGGRPRFCLPPVTQLVGKAAAPCSQTCALPAANPGSACNGSLTLDLDGSFLLTSVTLRFCTAGPPALVLSAAWSIGGPWRPLWRRPAWPGALGGPKKVTFHSLPGPKTRIVVSYLRVEFGGKAGLVTTGVRGRCQCHGHAARCATRAQPPRCRCRHHTTGPGCESCRPSHRDWPWRPATPQHPHPCLRKLWVLLPILATTWPPGTACQHVLAPCPKACSVLFPSEMLFLACSRSLWSGSLSLFAKHVRHTEKHTKPSVRDSTPRCDQWTHQSSPEQIISQGVVWRQVWARIQADVLPDSWETRPREYLSRKHSDGPPAASLLSG